jgi:S-adenosylmethionine hydrolase
MGILTFTSDFGLRDYYVSAVKGAVLSQLPNVQIVDISHEVQAFSIMEAGYLVKSAYHHFPKGTVHIIGVGSESDHALPHRVVLYDGHYFIGTDTGVFKLIFKRAPDAIFDLSIPSSSDVLTFPVLHLFVQAACHLLRGGTPEVIGRKVAELRDSHQGNVFFDDDSIKGHIIHVDRYDNLVTDITQNVFKEVGRGRPFKISLRTKKYTLSKLSTHYADVPPGAAVAIFNTAGHLEIAIRNGAGDAGGGAAGLLGLGRTDLVLVVFDREFKPMPRVIEPSSIQHRELR